MKRVLLALLLMVASVTGCTDIGGLTDIVCSFYDSNGDGALDIDEARRANDILSGLGLGDLATDEEILDAFEDVYGCTVERD